MNKFFIKKIIYYFLSKIFFSLPKNSKGIILCYHRASNSKIYDNSDPNASLTLSIDEFKKQILKINSRYRIVSMKDFMSHINSDSKEFLVVITFDDGYYDNYNELLPLISELKIPITIYITTSFISKNRCFIWWYELWYYIKLNSNLKFDDSNYEISNYKKKIHTFETISKIIINKDKENSWLKLQKKIRQFNLNNVSNSISLNISQLKQLNANKFINIGSHSVNHFNMSKLSREELQYELVNSKKILEKILKNKITDFAFPFGTNNEVSEREINELNNSDYTSAVTTYNSPIMKGCNFYSLPRVGIDKSINHKNIFGIFSRYSYLLKGISKYLKL